MEDCSEIVLKRICCTCLSKNRKLFQLCRVADGINNLYLLLSSDTEAYREGFFKDTASLFICWECKAVMRKITKFRRNACIAQKQLTAIADGRDDIKLGNASLSYLTTHCLVTYETVISETSVSPSGDNFIDCGPVELKTESDIDDVPLSELQNYEDSFQTDHCIDMDHLESADVKTDTSNIENREKYPRRIKKTRSVKGKIKQKFRSVKYYSTVQITEGELLDYREKRKLTAAFADATAKCELCLEGFKSYIDLERHNESLHKEKTNHSQCQICYVYVPKDSLLEHRQNHYQKLNCRLCDYVCHSQVDILRHLKYVHAMQGRLVPWRKGQRTTPQVKNPGSKPRISRIMSDKQTPYGFKCPECDKYFENKNLRYKHIRRFHSEGFSCTVCGKRYPFKDNLIKHERLHQGPLPREECETCHKMIRIDLVKTHARIHTRRESYTCVECDKKYVSRASYENHLKYSQAHAAVDVLKYKCLMCDKGYRSKGELRDHTNYQHLGKTQHKCPICDKALATRRCITRHVRRAHHNIKESPRDKICQQCGKAFRDKKGLREHEFIHTGERPLSCEICGCTFRQSASLYTHRKRVHSIYPSRKNVQHLED